MKGEFMDKIFLGVITICFILTIITRYYYYATLDKSNTARHKKLCDKETKEDIFNNSKN